MPNRLWEAFKSFLRPASIASNVVWYLIFLAVPAVISVVGGVLLHLSVLEKIIVGVALFLFLVAAGIAWRERHTVPRAPTSAVTQRQKPRWYVVEARVRGSEVFVAITNKGPKASFMVEVVQVRDVSPPTGLPVPWRVQWVGADFNKRALDSDEMQELILGELRIESVHGLPGSATRPYFYFLTPSGNVEVLEFHNLPHKFDLRLCIRCNDDLRDYVVWIEATPAARPTDSPSAYVTARSALWEDR